MTKAERSSEAKAPQLFGTGGVLLQYVEETIGEDAFRSLLISACSRLFMNYLGKVTIFEHPEMMNFVAGDDVDQGTDTEFKSRSQTPPI